MDANTWEAMELKMMAGLEMEMVGVTGKLRETVGSEVEMVVGMESGADTEVGTDSKLRSDRSGAGVGAEASAIVTTGGDAGADVRLTVVGTTTGDDATVVTNV